MTLKASLLTHSLTLSTLPGHILKVQCLSKQAVLRSSWCKYFTTQLPCLLAQIAFLQFTYFMP